MSRSERQGGGLRLQRSQLVILLFVVIVTIVGLFQESRAIFSISSDSHEVKKISAGLSSLSTEPTNDETSQASDSICDILSNGTGYPSASSVWHTFQNNILNASYFPEYVADNSTFRNWVDDLFEYHHQSKLRKTVVNRPASNSVRKIIEIIDRRLEYLDEQNDDTTDVEPLHILVLGGSVTFGHDCWINPLGMSMKRNCTWPARLENMFNEGIFGGRKVVKVTNMAYGGSSSEIGALVVKYQMFPKNVIPHIIMAAFTPNDHMQPDIEKVFSQEIQDFVQNAINVCPCNKDLPLVVLADHMYLPDGKHIWEEQLRLSGYNAVLAAWYDVMAFNQGNLARHHLIANFDNQTKIEQLMGSGFALHLGVGFHIGLAWTALFNFLEAFVDNCNDLKLPPSSTSTSTNLSQSDVTSANSRIDDLFTTPSMKQLPKLSNQDRLDESLSLWKQRHAEAESRCSSVTANNKTNTDCTGENRVCSHAWIVGKGTGINTQDELRQVLNPVLKSSNGWVVKGRPVRNPRVGLYAEKANATFVMKFPITENPMNFLTIFSMKSYGPDWIGSKMEIRMTIEHPGNTTDTAIHEIDGFHEIKTSVHFPHKFALPGNGASVGDTFILEGTIVGGSMFKIHGMALCRF